MKELVLIIDDEIAEDLARLLKGYKIDIAKNKEEALKKAFSKRPKVISLDNYMPADKCDKEIAPYGNIIARSVKRYMPETKIVGVSSAPNQLDPTFFDKIIDKKNFCPKKYKEIIVNYLKIKK